MERVELLTALEEPGAVSAFRAHVQPRSSRCAQLVEAVLAAPRDARGLHPPVAESDDTPWDDAARARAPDAARRERYCAPGGRSAPR